jgi:hypothetical protein
MTANTTMDSTLVAKMLARNGRSLTIDNVRLSIASALRVRLRVTTRSRVGRLAIRRSPFPILAGRVRDPARTLLFGDRARPAAVFDVSTGAHTALSAETPSETA